MLADAKLSEIMRDTERIFGIYGPIFLSHGLAVALSVVMANTTDLRERQIIAWSHVLTLMGSNFCLGRKAK